MDAKIYAFPMIVRKLPDPKDPRQMICACWRAVKYEHVREIILAAALKIFDRANIAQIKFDPVSVEEAIKTILDRVRNGSIKGPEEFANRVANLARYMGTERLLPAPK